MERKLIRIAWAAWVAILAFAGGCSSHVGAGDPEMSSSQEQEMRSRAYTPEQIEERAQRPR